MPVTVTAGSATIIALSDTEQPYDAAAVYPEVTAAQWEPYRALLSDDGKVLLNFGCYVVQADGRTVLIDTGWGPGFKGQLLEELRAAGVDAGSIDTVMFTHLHGDHIGWNLDEGGQPRFPGARYLLPEADWQHYRAQPELPALFRSQCLPLEALGVLELVSGERRLSPSLTIVPAPGHTPGHMGLAAVSGGERAFILGDAAISPADAIETQWANRFDWDSTIARQTRERLLADLEQGGALIAASHFPRPGLGRLTSVDGRRMWQPL